MSVELAVIRPVFSIKETSDAFFTVSTFASNGVFMAPVDHELVGVVSHGDEEQLDKSMRSILTLMKRLYIG